MGSFDLVEAKKAVAGLIAAAVTSGVSFVVLHLGLDLDASATAAISTALTALVVNRTVFKVPNQVRL